MKIPNTSQTIGQYRTEQKHHQSPNVQIQPPPDVAKGFAQLTGKMGELFGKYATEKLKNKNRAIIETHKQTGENEVELFKQNLETEGIHNSKNSEVFKAELEKVIKDADRELQIQIGEYKSLNDKYTQDISLYTTELSEKVTKYKWFMEQYINFVNQYNGGIMSIAKPREKSQDTQGNRRKQGGR